MNTGLLLFLGLEGGEVGGEDWALGVEGEEGGEDSILESGGEVSTLVGGGEVWVLGSEVVNTGFLCSPLTQGTQTHAAFWLEYSNKSKNLFMSWFQFM